jgi:hypothetical protein
VIDHPRYVWTAIDIVAESDDPLFTRDGRAIGEDLLLQSFELAEVAVDVADRIDRAGPSFEGQSCSRHSGVFRLFSRKGASRACPQWLNEKALVSYESLFCTRLVGS